MNKIIQNKPNALVKTPSPSPMPSLARMLIVTSQVMGKELQPEEIELWKGLTSSFAETEIEEAFNSHLASSNFFPKPAEIIGRVMSIRRSSIEEKSVEIAEKEEAKEAEYRANGGQYISFDEIRDKLLEICKIPSNRFKPIVISPERREILQQQVEQLKRKK